jgi:hypothetical protein
VDTVWRLHWTDKIGEDLREKGWRREEALDRRVWRSRIKDGNNIDLNEIWKRGHKRRTIQCQPITLTRPQSVRRCEWWT